MVTGAAGGIGKATAHKLASRGVSIVIVDMNEKDGTQVAEEIAKKWNVRSKFLKVDITQEQAVKDAIASTLEWTGRIDYAANCAGICESIWAEEESITTELFDKYDCYSSIWDARSDPRRTHWSLGHTPSTLEGCGSVKSFRRSKCEPRGPGPSPFLLNLNTPYPANAVQLPTSCLSPAFKRLGWQRTRPASMRQLE